MFKELPGNLTQYERDMRLFETPVAIKGLHDRETVQKPKKVSLGRPGFNDKG